jgi:hypothetical protein
MDYSEGGNSGWVGGNVLRQGFSRSGQQPLEQNSFPSETSQTQSGNSGRVGGIVLGRQYGSRQSYM